MAFDDRKKTPAGAKPSGRASAEVTEQTIKDGFEAIVEDIKDESIVEALNVWNKERYKVKKRSHYIGLKGADLDTVKGNKEAIQKIIKGSADAVDDGTKNSLRIAEGGTKIVKMITENIKLLGENYEAKIEELKETLSKYADTGRIINAKNKVLEAENEQLKAKLETMGSNADSE